LGSCTRVFEEARARPAMQTAPSLEPSLTLTETLLDLRDPDPAGERTGRWLLARNPFEVMGALVAFVEHDLDIGLPFRDAPPGQVLVDRPGCELPIGDGGDRDPRAERGVTARVGPGCGRRQRRRVDRDAPPARLDPVLRAEEAEIGRLPNRDDDGVRGEKALGS